MHRCTVNHSICVVKNTRFTRIFQSDSYHKTEIDVTFSFETTGNVKGAKLKSFMENDYSKGFAKATITILLKFFTGREKYQNFQ